MIFSARAGVSHTHRTGHRQWPARNHVVVNTARLRNFVTDFTRLTDEAQGNEGRFLQAGKGLLAELVRTDDWLPTAFALASPSRYQQYLLHCDPLQRFSVVSFVWDKGQETPIHNHTVWGLIGVLRGAEVSTRYATQDTPMPLQEGSTERLEAGEIDTVSPTIGDIHRVANAYTDRVSISIHVYGANIGAVRRATFSRQDGSTRDFISEYARDVTPNLWSAST